MKHMYLFRSKSHDIEISSNSHAKLFYDYNVDKKCVTMKLWSRLFFFNFWDHWYHYFGLLVSPVLGFKARVDPSLVYFLTCVQWIPQIHHRYDTCWLLGSQHGSWAFLIHVLADPVSTTIGGVTNPWPSVPQYKALNHSAIPAWQIAIMFVDISLWGSHSTIHPEKFLN